tara:strand:+ start:72 stop:392 length:321 start_codon:yes stop_codon:yes gene_type:complete
MKTLALAAAFVAAFFTSSVHAMTIPCFMGNGPDIFKDMHNEDVLATGKSPDGATYFILLNPETKSWTVIVERPGDGEFFCPVASGEKFKLLPPPAIKTKTEKGLNT